MAMTNPTPLQLVPHVARAIVNAARESGKDATTFSVKWLWLDAPSLLVSPNAIMRTTRAHFHKLQDRCAGEGWRLVSYDGRGEGFRVRRLRAADANPHLDQRKR